MKVGYLLVILFSVFLNAGFAQNEANIWYFGQNAGLDFNSGTPVALEDGQLITQEGCATISDGIGNLLFYTDGTTVYNRNHALMLNGNDLNGHPSSTQSAIIIPKPGSSYIYYIFTVDYQGQPNGLQYSEVDMTMDAGLGAVTSNKNIMLLTPVMEKLSAVKHSNGVDIWVLAHKNGSAEFYAYLVTNSGIQTPVITSIGNDYGGPGYGENAGYLKFSSDGSKVATVYGRSLNGLQVFDFDNSTGVLSNLRNIFYGGSSVGASYGVEFSPSGEIIYVSGHGGIVQYDLTLPSDFQIQLNIVRLIQEIENNSWGALQLATDGKIYITRSGREDSPDVHHLSVINNPDEVGLGCDFQLDVIDLGTGIAKSGLPPFMQSFFNVGFQYENLCFGEATVFNSNLPDNYDSLEWDFGDGNTSTDENPIHTFLSLGDFNVTLTVSSGSETTSETKLVRIYDVPTAYSISNQVFCDDDYDGHEAIDLSDFNSDILNGQSLDVFSVVYFDGMTNYNNNNPINSSLLDLSVLETRTIIASVRNSNNVSCEDMTIIDVSVEETPNPNTNLPILRECDNSSYGTSEDGIILFDLTQNEASILNGQSATEFTVNYYTDLALSNQITNPSSYQNTNTFETIYVQIVNNQNTNCNAVTQFDIEVLELPVVNSIVSLSQCDDDLDGYSMFNLNEVISEITINPESDTVTFYELPLDAEDGNSPIINPFTYVNESISSDVIWARIENGNGCHRVSQVNLFVSTTQIPSTYSRDFYKCDDGDNITDGVATFDLTSVNYEVEALFPTGQQLVISYYRNQADALSEVNPILDIANYQNIGYPFIQDIFVRVDSDVDNDCLGLGHHVTLHVETIPTAFSVNLDEQCDDDGDGMYAFDTSTVESILINGQSNVIVRYTDENGSPLPSPLPNPFVTASQTIRATVINSLSLDPNGACFDETQIVFTVDEAAIAHTVPDFIECDDDNDGQFAFDTSPIESIVLNGQTGMIVSYYDEMGNELPSPLPNPFITDSQIVTVRVENELSSICYDETIVNFVVVEQPQLSMDDTWSICEGSNVELIADMGYDEYLWSTGDTSQSIIVDIPGTYDVTATNIYGGIRCETSQTVTVLESGIATITEIEIEDWSANNNQIVVMVEGAGDYEYSLDGINYQDSNVFSYLDVDDYTVFVRDKNGCGIVTEDVYLLYYPKVFTPNGDGTNDTWQLYNSNKEQSNIVYIYDRYGKLLKQLNPNSTGWDGSFKGNIMPNSDYWFVLKRQNGKEYRGHFSLKR
ncbi:T9SS type B sorting domain-containing protein [Hanstruepera marina]|uniref:T9SS type B sorting domain-containing protein n=1 Tax=Hanstruepera marina TaxID=2873265 RepID=UPI001CA730DE|nr:T9SS type B sorting domain-containing protein [Hanstruepera marina]